MRLGYGGYAVKAYYITLTDYRYTTKKPLRRVTN
nr:MAG TPA: hypothetical protein [Microviridae sp.]